MIVFPLFVNVLGYWIADNLLKKEQFEENEESLKQSFYQSKTSRYHHYPSQQATYSEFQGKSGGNVRKKEEEFEGPEVDYRPNSEAAG